MDATMDVSMRDLSISGQGRSIFSELPLELWSAVSAKLLLHKASLSALRIVSRRCREAVEWSIRVLEPHAGISETHLLQLLQRFHGIRALKLNDLSQPASTQLMTALRRLHKLRKLHLIGRNSLIASADDLTACRRLTSVTLERTDGYFSPDVYAAISQMRRLRSVVVRDACAAADWGKTAPAEGFGLQALVVLTRLTHLDLGGMAAPAVARVAAGLPALSSLAIKIDLDYNGPVEDNSKQDQMAIASLIGVPLQRLTMMAHIDAPLLPFLQLRNLLTESSWIQIGGSVSEEEEEEVVDEEVVALKVQHLLSQLKGLTALTSPALEWLRTPEAAALVVPHMSSLQNLTLKGAVLTPDAAEAMNSARITARLQTVAAEGVSGGGLPVLLPALRAATVLRVNGADVDPRGHARDLARLAGMLREVDMRSTIPVHDEAISEFVRLGTLTCLRLGSSAHGASSLCITDAAVSEITEGLPFLRRLQLSGGAQLTDGGLASLARLSELTNLRLDECRQLTGQGLADVAVAEIPLRKLRLDGTNCNDGGLVVISVIPHLTSLHIGNRPAQQVLTHHSWAPWSHNSPPPPDFQMRLLQPGSCQVNLPDRPQRDEHLSALTALMEDSEADDPSGASSYYYDPSGSMQYGSAGFFNRRNSSNAIFTGQGTLNPPSSGTIASQGNFPSQDASFSVGSPVHGGSSALAAFTATANQTESSLPKTYTAFAPTATKPNPDPDQVMSHADTPGEYNAETGRCAGGLHSQGSFGIASLNSLPLSASAVKGAMALATASTHGGSLYANREDSSAFMGSVHSKAGIPHAGTGLREYPPSPIRRLIIDSSILSDASLTEAAAALPSLAHLELRRCSRPDGSGLAAFKGHSDLSRIVVRECGGLTSSRLQEGLAPLTQLQELSVVRCSGIRPSALADVECTFKAATGRTLQIRQS